MEVIFFQAECGDAACIHFLGSDNKYHNIFIDSGYSRTFRFALEDIIQNISDNQEKIDLWIISHIHNDHIGGILKYIDTIQSGEKKDIIENFLYNSPRDYNSENYYQNVSEFMSIDQGDALYEYIKSKGKFLNIDITNLSDSINIYGLKITILSPTKNALKKLRSKYKSPSKRLEKEEYELISEKMTPVSNDYKKLFSEFDLNSFQKDNSIENGSSIAFISEHQNKKVLWLADSHPDIVVKSIKNLGYTVKNKLKCEWVKVAHHGGKGNNSNELFSLIDCENFLFSANAENKYNLPSKECIARLLRNKNRDSKKINLHFLYDNSLIRSIFNVENSSIFKELNFNVIFSNNKLYRVDI